jgi:FkbM family methyltransferase
MFDILSFWKSKGMDPKVIYDIGGCEGSWAYNIKRLFPDAHLEVFEANPDMKSKIEQYNHHIVLLGNESKKDVQFFKNTVGCNTGNSIYLEQTVYFTPQTAVIQLMNMHTLNDFVKENNLKKPEFIKLDVQGAELDILKGMTDLMDSVKYFVIECSLHKYNKDSPMIEEIVAYLHKYNFVMIDIVELHRIHGTLVQVDVLFAHSSTGMRKEHFYDIGMF